MTVTAFPFRFVPCCIFLVGALFIALIESGLSPFLPRAHQKAEDWTVKPLLSSLFLSSFLMVLLKQVKDRTPLRARLMAVTCDECICSKNCILQLF